ncbi:MAG: Xylose isomerase domain protein barrel, partial [Sediminibacterium sp.]|nr:Xylose isomerase domain protein barrel [Sediminibacterium sp.]
MANQSNRRLAIKNILAGSAALAAGSSLPAFGAGKKTAMLKGNIQHAVCRWCFNDLTLDQLCVAANDIGIKGIDLVPPKDWDTLKKYNLQSTMCNGAEISLGKGWNDKQYHPTLIKNYTEHIDLVANAGFKNLFCASGNRNGMDDETGLRNCVDGLKQVIGQAEKRGVVLQMELLNSKIDHKDYMCDRTAWGVELCKRIASPNFKLLYDIYHMQIDEGDVIRTIRDYNTYIGHYHTAGVPGRHEIDETQELYYPAIMKAILATGFTDYVAQEFIPVAADKIGSLRKAVM